MIPLVDLNAEYRLVRPLILEAVHDVLESGVFVLGPKGRAIEKRIADYLGVGYAVGVANGTDALVLALEGLGIGDGDEVLTTPFTFFATAEAIVRVGATPVFVDIDPLTYNLNPYLIEPKLSRRTKAIIVVHLFGHPVDMDPIVQLSHAYGLKVIEDMCQSFGAEYLGRKTGVFGDAACISFFPSKNLGGYGDGGMVVTNDAALHERIGMLRNHGSREKYKHEMIGTNSRLDELQAAVLGVKLSFVDAWNDRRKQAAARYSRALQGSVKTPYEAPDTVHVYHQYCIESEDRDGLAAFLASRQIAHAIYYPKPLHLQKALAHLAYREGDLPVAEQVSGQILALPMHGVITDDHVDAVISAIADWSSHHGGRG